MIYPLQHYQSKLGVYETQLAIKHLKDTFEARLAKALNLTRVSAPLFLKKSSGLNDDLNGVERKVHFTSKCIGKEEIQVVQSLAKWKRFALGKYAFKEGQGLYADMNAIRRDETLDNLHSLYVDQWDWCKIISREQRNVDFLKETVKQIVFALCDTLDELKRSYPAVNVNINRNIKFITTQELEDMYPDKTPKERERLIVKEHGTVFLMQIGGELKSGIKHDGRAPDYDDWSLNGDILVWDRVLDNALEISSMGIRVDEKSLEKQLEICGAMGRMQYDYHKMIADGTLPLTIGGGIGQSRLCMLLLEKAHIGEVQASIWSDEMTEKCKENGIVLL